MKTLDELDALYQQTKRKPWTFDSAVNEVDYADVRSVFKVAARYEAEAAARYAVAVANAWPGISARLRAAEVDAANLRVMLGRALDEHRVEVERLRRLCRVAAARIDDDALALAELLDDQDAPVDGGALADALSRAALGEP